MRPYRGYNLGNGDEVKGWLFERAGASFIIPITDKYHTPASFVLTFVQVDPATVGQSTGLKDKNGKDLDWWEGDVFDHPSGKCVIKWYYGGLYMHSSGGYCPVGDAAEWAVLPKKIGNIHEELKK